MVINMKKALKILSLTFAIVMIFSACGNSTENTPTAETTSSYTYQEPITYASETTDFAVDTAPAVEGTAAETVAQIVTEAETQATTQSVAPEVQTPATQAPATQAPAATKAPVTQATTSAPVYKMPKTKAEIVEYFNTGANKVKTEATRVTKNYEKRTVGEMVVPQALQATADKLVSEYMSDDTTPIVYSTQSEIRENFIVPKQDYVSRLTLNDIKDITIKDAGNEFEICITLKDEMNPKSGSGVGAVCDVIEAGDVTGNKMVQSFSTNYYNCVVKAKFDKVSGRMVWANYTTPLTLELTVNLLGTHNGKLGLTFEKDYNIEY